MIKGLTEDETDIVCQILKPYLSDYEFYAYGSRVKGNYSKLSDLDILIKGNNAFPAEQLDMLKIMFDNSQLPFIVNFSDYYNIDESFYKIISKDLVKIQQIT